MAEKSFEKALMELEKLVAQLEKGDLTLDKSIQLYEKAVRLTRCCNEELQQAQLKLEELKVGKTDESL